MPVLRFSDLCAQGRVKGKRVFIRCDLNAPLNEAREITEDPPDPGTNRGSPDYEIGRASCRERV